MLDIFAFMDFNIFIFDETRLKAYTRTVNCNLWRDLCFMRDEIARIPCMRIIVCNKRERLPRIFKTQKRHHKSLEVFCLATIGH